MLIEEIHCQTNIKNAQGVKNGRSENIITYEKQLLSGQPVAS